MIDLTPMRWDWPDLTKGDTFPATQITESQSDTALTRVTIRIEPQGSNSAALVLDSTDGGVTINTATAGAWDFTIDEITPSQTNQLTPGVYDVSTRITDDAGTVITEFKGEWKILEP